MVENRLCPICNKVYRSRPAISRVDNATLICPECGQRQALESIGIVGEEQDHIVELSRGYGNADEEKSSK